MSSQISDGATWSRRPVKNATRTTASANGSRCPSNGANSLSLMPGTALRLRPRDDVLAVLVAVHVDRDRVAGAAQRAIAQVTQVGGREHRVERDAGARVAERRAWFQVG